MDHEQTMPYLADDGTQGVAPLTKRPFDLVLVVFFAIFTMTSFLFDLQTALRIPQDPNGSFFVRSQHAFAVAADPVLLDPPAWMQMMCVVSAFVCGPFWILLLYAFVRGRDWIRIPAIAGSSAVIYSLVLIFLIAAFGETRPRNVPLYLAAYLPYMIVPAALIWRMRRPAPFAAYREARRT